MKPYLLTFLTIALTSVLLMNCGKRHGDRGPAGTAAEPCTTVAFDGGADIICPDGTHTTIYNGAQGNAGSNGNDGSTGAAGSPGIPGAPGSQVQAITFCPGYTPDYPTTFPEIGFCVDNKLYGVFWDGHNSWWTLIVPGTYASTSTNAACTFTVGPNCLITH